MAMIGNGDHIVGGRDSHLNGSPEFDFTEHSGDIVRLRIENDESLVTGRIADRDQPSAIIEPLQKTVTDTIPLAMLDDRALPIAHREGLATGGQGYGMTVWMKCDGIEIREGRDKLAIELGALTGEFDRHVPHLFQNRVEEVEVRARVEDQTRTIRGEMADVELLLIGMAAQILASGGAGVDVANAFMVGNEVDALSHPTRAGNVPLKFEQALEDAATIGITPQMPDCASAIALPIGRFIDIAPNDNASLGAVGDGAGHTDGELSWLPTLGTDRINDLIFAHKLPGAASEDNGIVLRRPIQDAAGRIGLEGQALSWSTMGGHNIHLARSFFTSDEREKLTIA